MRRHPLPAADRHPDVLTLAAATWLACGIVLLGLTPMPWHDASSGWSLAFWLLAAPILLLLVRWAFRQKQPRSPNQRPYRETVGSIGARSRLRRLPCSVTRNPGPGTRSTRVVPLSRHTLTPLRLASIRRSSSCMMRR